MNPEFPSPQLTPPQEMPEAMRPGSGLRPENDEDATRLYQQELVDFTSNYMPYALALLSRHHKASMADARELLQQTAVIALNKYQDFEWRNTPTSFFCAILKNLSSEWLNPDRRRIGRRREGQADPEFWQRLSLNLATPHPEEGWNRELDRKKINLLIKEFFDLPENARYAKIFQLRMAGHYNRDIKNEDPRVSLHYSRVLGRLKAFLNKRLGLTNRIQ